MIDIIKRNLYERSCDVRWWAPDSAMVDRAVEKGHVVGFALTSGYETYRGLGWYGVIVQNAFGSHG